MLGSKLYVHVHFMDSLKTRKVFGVKVGEGCTHGIFCAWLCFWFGAQSRGEVVGVFSDETSYSSLVLHIPA